MLLGSLERCIGHGVLVGNLERSVTVPGRSVKTLAEVRMDKEFLTNERLQREIEGESRFLRPKGLSYNLE